MLNTLADWANLATVVTGVAALFAIVFAVWQTRQFREQQLESMGRDNYQDFLDSCIEYPDYVAPLNEQVDVTGGTYAGDRRKFVQYEWFLTAGLNALESVFCSVGDQRVWRDTIENILDEHKAYLLSGRYDSEWKTFDPRFLRFVAKWLEKNGRPLAPEFQSFLAE